MPARTYFLPTRHLSFSQIRTYISCPACYEWETVLQKPRKIKYILAVGQGVHAAWAHARRTVMATLAVSIDECLQQAIEGLTKGLAQGDLLDPDPPREVILQEDSRYRTPAAAEKDVLEIVPESFAAHPIDVETNKFMPQTLLEHETEVGIAAVEDEVNFDGIFPFPFIGYRDVQYVTKETRDLKTTSRNVAPDAFAAMQLATYVLPDWKLSLIHI